MNPSSPLVVVAWIGQRVTGVTPAMTATTLPRDLTAWGTTGFVQASPVAGSPDIETGVRKPIVQIDAWAVSVDAGGNVGNNPPRKHAAELAERVFRATDNAQLFGRAVTLPAGYDPVRVFAAYPVTEIVDVTDGEPTGYARMTFDLALDWARA